MTHFSDTFYMGSPVTNISSNNNGGFGFGPLVPIYVYDITPATLSSNALAVNFTAGGAGSVTLAAGTDITAVTLPDGTTEYRFGTPRSVSLTSAGNISAVNFTITGLDIYGNVITEYRYRPSSQNIRPS